MDISAINTYISWVIPWATFIALGYSIYLFVKNKGTIDALKEAANTYKTLSESKQQVADDALVKLEECQSRVKGLRRELEEEQRAMELAIDELIAGFKRSIGG